MATAEPLTNITGSENRKRAVSSEEKPVYGPSQPVLYQQFCDVSTPSPPPQQQPQATTTTATTTSVQHNAQHHHAPHQQLQAGQQQQQPSHMPFSPSDLATLQMMMTMGMLPPFPGAAVAPPGGSTMPMGGLQEMYQQYLALSMAGLIPPPAGGGMGMMPMIPPHQSQMPSMMFGAHTNNHSQQYTSGTSPGREMKLNPAAQPFSFHNTSLSAQDTSMPSSHDAANNSNNNNNSDGPCQCIYCQDAQVQLATPQRTTRAEGFTANTSSSKVRPANTTLFSPMENTPAPMDYSAEESTPVTKATTTTITNTVGGTTTLGGGGLVPLGESSDFFSHHTHQPSSLPQQQTQGPQTYKTPMNKNALRAARGLPAVGEVTPTSHTQQPNNNGGSNRKNNNRQANNNDQQRSPANEQQRSPETSAALAKLRAFAGTQSSYLVTLQGHRDSKTEVLSGIQLRHGEHVIYEGDRGEDMGCVIGIQNSKDVVPTPGKKETKAYVIRSATEAEIYDWSVKQPNDASEAALVGEELARELKIPMTVVGAVFQFDRKKLSVYYRSADRVDFRRFNADMYNKYRCRIWMVREEES